MYLRDDGNIGMKLLRVLVKYMCTRLYDIPNINALTLCKTTTCFYFWCDPKDIWQLNKKYNRHFRSMGIFSTLTYFKLSVLDFELLFSI